MNPPLFGDRTSKACSSYNDKEIQRNIERNFNKDLYKDVMIYLEKVILKDNFILCLEDLYLMIKNHLLNGYIQHHLLVKKGNGIQCTALSAEYRGTGVGLVQGPSGS